MFSLNWLLEIGRLPRRGWEEAASSNNCCGAGAAAGPAASFFEEAIGLVPPGLLLYMVLLRSHRTAHLYILCLLALPVTSLSYSFFLSFAIARTTTIGTRTTESESMPLQEGRLIFWVGCGIVYCNHRARDSGDVFTIETIYKVFCVD